MLGEALALLDVTDTCKPESNKLLLSGSAPPIHPPFKLALGCIFQAYWHTRQGVHKTQNTSY